MYDFILKKILLKFDAENAHNMSMILLRIFSAFPQLNLGSSSHFVLNKSLHQNIDGMNFLNPLGIGAGFDKNATAIKALSSFGFGFCEVGTITPNSQCGNTKPRIFRHIDELSLQNSLGFNNDGSQIVKHRLDKIYPFRTPIGVNVGKNSNVSEEDSIKDYIFMLKAFKDLCDYFVINISSPNTKGLRNLQNDEFIKELFENAKSITDKPIYLKIAPDLEIDEAISLAQNAVSSGASGIIATNTTNDYSVVNNPINKGGISGLALKEKSFTLFKEIAKVLHTKTTLISVGGIDSANEAYRRIRHGANLIQLYTAFVYQGYHIARDINNELVSLLEKDGFNNISEAVGVDL